MELITNLLNNALIQSINNTAPVGATESTAVRVKRGDTGGIDWIFATPFVGGSEIDDDGADPDLSLTMKFGVKEQGDFPGAYLVNSTTFSKIGTGEDAIYRMPVSLNTVELNDDLVVGTIAQRAADTAARLAITGLTAGAIVAQDDTTTYWELINAAAPSNPVSWSTAVQHPSRTYIAELEVILDSRIFSTITFFLQVDNDVNKGSEGVPINATPQYPTASSIIAFMADLSQAVPASLTALKAIASVGKTGRIIPVIDTGTLRWYQYQAGTTAESSPGILRPTDYAATTNETILVQVL